jgi:hypothetical protein
MGRPLISTSGVIKLVVNVLLLMCFLGGKGQFLSAFDKIAIVYFTPEVRVLLTLRAYEIESPTTPAERESRPMTANRAEKKTMNWPTNSRCTASQRFDTMLG